MTHTSAQSQDIFAIAGISNLDTEQAARISIQISHHSILTCNLRLGQ